MLMFFYRRLMPVQAASVRLNFGWVAVQWMAA